MDLRDILVMSPEVEAAVAEHRPVVALESVMVAHGLPYPINIETGLKMEKIIRENGAIPATIAMLGGKLKVGLTEEELRYVGSPDNHLAKASRRDLPVLAALGRDSATTVSATIIAASMAGIEIMTAGGLGGVHRGAQRTMYISTDLEELAHTPVMVLCAGPKAILDLGLTLEYLETKGVPVVGYQTDDFPAFFTRKSGFSVDYCLDTPEQVALAFKMERRMGYPGGMVVTNPIPQEYAMEGELVWKAIDEAQREAEEQGIAGKEVTPFLLSRVSKLTEGSSVEANLQLSYANCVVVAQIAKAYAKIK